MHEIPGGTGEAAGAEVRSGAGVWLRVGDIGDGLLLSALGLGTVLRQGDRPGRGTVHHWSGRRHPPRAPLLCPALGRLGAGVIDLAGHRRPPLLSILGLVLPCDRSQSLLLCGLHDPSQLFRGLHQAIIIFSIVEFRLIVISAAQWTKERERNEEV